MAFDVALNLRTVGAQTVVQDLTRVEGAVGGLGGALDGSTAGAARFRDSLSEMGRLAAGGSLLAGVMLGINSASKALYDASVNAERLRLGLNFSSGGKGADELSYLRRVTNDLGLQFGTTADAYMKFAAAARQTSLEGDGARKIFESVSKASAVMGLSAEQSGGALTALQQMISKGTVSAEELRGQLGERLPGSFQIAARAMGVTTQELGKMLEQGQVLSEDFLPKFSEQLKTELGGAADVASQRLEAATNRLANAWDKLKANVGDAGASKGMAEATGGLTFELEALSGAMDDAKARGAGFWGQMNQALGMFLGRTLQLHRVSDDFYSSAQRLQLFGHRISEAETQMAKLQERLQANPESIYLRSDIAQLQKFIDKQAQAQAQARLGLMDPKLLESMPDQNDAETARLGLGDANAAEMARLSRRAQAATEQGKWFEKYRTDAQRLREELAQVRTAFDGVIPADLEQRIREKYIKPTRELSATLKSQLAFEKQVMEWRQDWHKLDIEQGRAEVKAIQEYEKAESDRRDSEVKAAGAALAAAEFEYKTYGMLRSQIAGVTLQRLEDKQKAFEAGSSNFKAVEAEIKAQRKLIDVLQRGEVRESSDKAAQDAAAEWKRTADSIEQSLTDALLRGFEGGKGFAKNLRDSVVNLFKSLALPKLMGGLLDGLGVKAGIGGLLGVASGSAAAGTGASISGGLLGAVGLGGLSMTSIGSAIGAGFMNTIGGGTILGGQGAGLLAGGASTGTGIAGIVGGALPWVGAAALLANAFGLFRSNKQVGAGITGTLGGTVEDFTVNRRGGSLFSGPSYSTPTTGTSSQNAALQDTFAALREQAAQRAGVLGLDAAAARAFTTALGSEKLSDDTGGLGIRLEGLSQDEAAKKIQTELEKANERLAESLLGPLQTFRKASETASQALERLSGIQVFSNNLTQLGSVFTRVAGLSFDARQQMIDLAGGLDVFGQQALGFVQNYYSRDEIAALKAKEIQGVLQGAGLGTDINSRDQFRALVEGLDVGTEAGRKQLATLLGLQGSFTSVADYLAETGTTLGQAASAAPAMGSLGPLLSTGQQQVGAINEVRDATWDVRDAIDRLADRIGGAIGLPDADVATWRNGPRLVEVGLA